jgi:hypothetical protein
MIQHCVLILAHTTNISLLGFISSTVLLNVIHLHVFSTVNLVLISSSICSTVVTSLLTKLCFRLSFASDLSVGWIFSLNGMNLWLCRIILQCPWWFGFSWHSLWHNTIFILCPSLKSLLPILILLTSFLYYDLILSARSNQVSLTGLLCLDGSMPISQNLWNIRPFFY